MKKIFGLVALLITGAMAATSALYLHHERSTQATVEADCQNREVCLDKVNLAPIGRFNDGTLWHGVTQEKPNVNLTGTLTVTGATVLSNNLTLSLFATGRIPYTTTAGLLTSGTGLTYNGSAFSVTGTADISGVVKLGTGTPSFATKRLTVIGNSFDNTALQLENTDVTLDADGRQFNLGVTDVSGTEGRLDLTQPGVRTILSVFKGGNVGIGSTTDGGTKFQVTGTGAISGNTTVGGTLGVTGVTTATGGLVLAGGSSTAAGFWKSATGGLAIRAATGSSHDLTLEGAAGNTLLRNPTGTFNLDFPQATGTSTFSGPLVAASTLGVTGVTTATGGLTLGASFVDKTTSLTSNTTLTSAHSTIFASASGGSFTITLPAAAGNTGLTYTIYKTDVSAAATGGGNTVTIDGNASETIGGSTTQVLASNTGNGTLRIICDGSNWRIESLLDQGSFLLTLTGCTTSPTSTSYYTRNNKSATMLIDNVTGTSNTTAATLTGLPSSLVPARYNIVTISGVVDNGLFYVGELSIDATISIYLKATATSLTTSTFTNSGQKGLIDQYSFSYSLQ